MGQEERESLAVQLARVEGSINAFLVTQGLHDKTITDHELRLRTMEQMPRAVTAKDLWLAVVGCATAAGGVAAVVAAVGG